MSAMPGNSVCGSTLAMLLYTLGLSYAHEASNQVKYEKQDADELFASLVYICCRKLAHPCRRDNTRVGAGCRQPPDSNSTFNSVHVPMLRSSPQCMGPLDRLEIVQRALFARPCASQGAVGCYGLETQATMKTGHRSIHGRKRMHSTVGVTTPPRPRSMCRSRLSPRH